MRTMNIEEYLTNFPDASLKDYQEYLTACKNATAKEKVDKRAKIDKWYADLVGRYFIINHNGVSYTIVYIDKELKYSDVGACNVYFEGYKLYNDGGSCHFAYAKNYRINPLWFRCPYCDERTYEIDNKVMEITKEEYERYHKEYENVANIIKTLKVDIYAKELQENF